MTLLRAALLEFLVCLHLLGAALIFRCLFPRESPWLALFIPTLAVLFALNFIEHFLALPQLGWLLPFTLGGSILTLRRSGPLWDGFRLPYALFVGTFTYILIIRGLHPEIPCWTEGLADLNRVLDFCLGEKVPPTDCWLPPYDHGGYYTFQHYGASILKRLFCLDIGTGYNVSFVFLDTLICLMAAAVAFSLSGQNWIAAAILLVVMASFTGSSLLMILFGAHGFDALLYYDLHHGWADAHHNPLWWLLEGDPDKQQTRLFAPGSTIYLPEFHPNMAGHFLTLMSLFASVEIFKEARSNWPWILLVVLPVLTVIAATWFLPVVLVFCVGTLVLALATSRRPQAISFVVPASLIAIGLIWPSVARLTGGSDEQSLRWTQPSEHTFLPLFLEQWWPVCVPWLLLCFVWRNLSLPARWFHAAVPLLLIVFEFFTIGERDLTLEKIWSALYGAGLVVFLTLVFRQRHWPFRVVTVGMLAVTLLCLRAWMIESTKGVDRGRLFFRLQGDVQLQSDPQSRRLLQVAQRLRGAILLCGTPRWSYSLTPAVAAFSENRCFVGWSYAEELAGNGSDEPERRRQLCDEFYAGKMAAPLSFLTDYHIAAVLIWPDDEIPDDRLTRLREQLGPAYDYVDCKQGGKNNAGVFLRSSGARAHLPRE
jgi:hypothetical protein